MKVTRQIPITLTEEQFKKLDKYNYAYSRNAQEQAENVYKEILRCELQLADIDYQVKKRKYQESLKED